jgi:excisionase family DNA binding protein
MTPLRRLPVADSQPDGQSDQASTNSLLLITPGGAAKLLAISPRTLWSMTASGEIPSVRVGKRGRRYSLAALQRWIEDRLADSGTSIEGGR